MSSLWFVLHREERMPANACAREWAETVAAKRDKERPDFAPHRAIRYDLADPERDAREAEALDAVLSERLPWLPATWPSPEHERVREILEGLRNRLTGGTK